MIKIIETNIKFYKNEIEDFQSRIIEVNNWDDYLDLYKNYNGEASAYFSGTLEGNTLPKNAEIIDFDYDEHHSICELKLWNGSFCTKLAYRI